VPVGAYLSGGLDSSTVACLAASCLGTKLNTFTGGFREDSRYDETRYARIVARHVRSEPHEIFPTQRNFIETMPQLIYHMDEPASGPGLFPQYFVSRLASRHVKVVLGGQGGDEIFGGYTRYLVAYLERCLKGGIEGTQGRDKYVVTLDSILPNLRQLKGYEPLLKTFWAKGLFESEERRYFRLIDRGEEIRPLIDPSFLPDLDNYDPFESYRRIFRSSKARSYITWMTDFDLKTLLPALLQVEDRASMAASLESRVPLLDHRIVELVASMPAMIKYRGGRSKHIFRQAIRHLVPSAIHGRTDKMGFPVPLSEWLRRGPVRDFVLETLQGRRAQAHGLIKTKRVAALLEDEKPFGRGIWGLLCIELWLQAFFDGKAASRSQAQRPRKTVRA
jgi:asparagine synthase (glutamine-hydrolysing)